jgi:hypothetical protein
LIYKRIADFPHFSIVISHPSGRGVAIFIKKTSLQPVIATPRSGESNLYLYLQIASSLLEGFAMTIYSIFEYRAARCVGSKHLEVADVLVIP